MTEDSDQIFEKKYSVYIEQTEFSYQGYIFEEPRLALTNKHRKNFILIFHFKKQPKNRNPLIMIDSLEGDDFAEKITIINHFKKNNALTYAVKVDQEGKLF